MASLLTCFCMQSLVSPEFTKRINLTTFLRPKGIPGSRSGKSHLRVIIEAFNLGPGVLKKVATEGEKTN